MLILSSFTHPYVIQTWVTFYCGHKRRYFEERGVFLIIKCHSEEFNVVWTFPTFFKICVNSVNAHFMWTVPLRLLWWSVRVMYCNRTPRRSRWTDAGGAEPAVKVPESGEVLNFLWKRHEVKTVTFVINVSKSAAEFLLDAVFNRAVCHTGVL